MGSAPTRIRVWCKAFLPLACTKYSQPSIKLFNCASQILTKYSQASTQVLADLFMFINSEVSLLADLHWIRSHHLITPMTSNHNKYFQNTPKHHKHHRHQLKVFGSVQSIRSYLTKYSQALTQLLAATYSQLILADL